MPQAGLDPPWQGRPTFNCMQSDSSISKAPWLDRKKNRKLILSKKIKFVKNLFLTEERGGDVTYWNSFIILALFPLIKTRIR